jgi:hypothetical protein
MYCQAKCFMLRNIYLGFENWSRGALATNILKFVSRYRSSGQSSQLRTKINSLLR